MPDTFAITIIAIAAVTLIGMFVRGRAKDRCLCHFENYTVTVSLKDGKSIGGKLSIESTGLEIVYEPESQESESRENSYILYKPEFANIQNILRAVDDLEPDAAERRDRIVEEICIPGSTHQFGRHVGNFISTVKDSLAEIFNVFMGRIRTASPAGLMTSQQKYISQAQAQLTGASQTAFESLLEKHVGQQVIVEIKKGDGIEKLRGLLREYTSDFLEIMDVDYTAGKDKPIVRADIILPRHSATVRHTS